jgi:hypothetical protein
LLYGLLVEINDGGLTLKGNVGLPDAVGLFQRLFNINRARIAVHSFYVQLGFHFILCLLENNYGLTEEAAALLVRTRGPSRAGTGRRSLEKARRASLLLRSMSGRGE